MIENNGVSLRIPAPLRVYTGRQSSVALMGVTISEAMAELVERFPGLGKHLYDDRGTLRSFVHLYVNGEDIEGLEGMDTPLSPGDKLAIIPAIAGG